MADERAFIRADEATTKGHCFILFCMARWLCSNTLSGPSLPNDRPRSRANSLPIRYRIPEDMFFMVFFSTRSVDDVTCVSLINSQSRRIRLDLFKILKREHGFQKCYFLVIHNEYNNTIWCLEDTPFL